MNDAPDDPMTPRACGCLARVLDVLDHHTEAPLRVRGHASSWTHEVFEVGRRYLLSVAATARDALLVPLRSVAVEER